MTDSPDSANNSTDRHPSKQHVRIRHRWTLIVVAALVAVWGLSMLYRMEIRAFWWGRQLARSQTPEEKHYYLLCLASIKDKALGTGVRLSRSADPGVRELSVAVLGNCKGHEAERILLGLLADASEEVGDAASLAIADPRRGNNLALLPEIAGVLHRGGHAARRAVVSIQRIPGDQSESILVDALSRTENPDLLVQIVDSLGMMASRRAVPRMIPLLEDTRPITHAPYSERAAARALVGARLQLAAKGLDSGTVLAAMPHSRTVADVALRSLQIIAGRSAPTTSTAPADVDALKSLRGQWQEWWQATGQSATEK